ncbi:MAG: type II toxin-antitoxin system death-on-curing family toxin [Opitutales bacterium]
MSPPEPHWLERAFILAVHERLLAEFGGGIDLRDPNQLKAALERPRQAFHDGVTALPELAANYAGGIILGHPFIHGNKRTGFLAAIAFLELNGLNFTATEPDAVLQTLALAASELTEEQYCEWLERHSKE